MTVAINHIAAAQNVGIGTATPNATAQLDVASSNKGFLLPRMTVFDRVLIANPANGLLVYDTTSNRMYLYQNGSWQYFINDSYWRTSSTRNWVYNTTDSIGIGTTTPTNRLDVNGNIRSRDDVLADGRVIATGVVSGSALQTPGNLAVAGIGIVSGNFTTNGNTTLNGDVTSTGDLIVDNITATLQLKNGSNVNKGFLQLSGDNVRIGTNSGNSDGNLVLRMNGNDRVTIKPSGDIDLDGKITRTATTGLSSLLPACYGKLNTNGGIVSGTINFTVTKGGSGEYRINSSAITSSSIIVGTSQFANRVVSVVAYNSYAEVRVYELSLGGPTDAPFSFIVF